MHIDFKGALIEGADITLWPGAKIYNAHLVRCNVDDVTHGPFNSGPVFYQCRLEEIIFRSSVEATRRLSGEEV